MKDYKCKKKVFRGIFVTLMKILLQVHNQWPKNRKSNNFYKNPSRFNNFHKNLLIKKNICNIEIRRVLHTFCESVLYVNYTIIVGSFSNVLLKSTVIIALRRWGVPGGEEKGHICDVTHLIIYYHLFLHRIY